SSPTRNRRTASPRARRIRIRAPYTTWTSSSRTVCAISPHSKIEGYGKYAWATGSSERLKNIQKLPNELFELIKVAPQPTPTPTTTTRAPRVAPVPPNNNNNNNRHRQGATGYQGTLLLPVHLPVGQLRHMAPSRHDI
ncbi:MAG: hypothetical protein ACKPKO_57785, partial [Candidatus Fonsibacter sp.]